MFQIGELAKRCGVTSDTLRFYEKKCVDKTRRAKRIRLPTL